jgi:hypothetical protein
MRMSVRSVLAALVAITVFSLTAMAGAQTVGDAVSTFTYTKNMKPLGYSPRIVPLANATPGAGIYNSDLAFWGKRAFQGTYSGFRIIDVSDPEKPVELRGVLARHDAGQPGRRDRLGQPARPVVELARDSHVVV